MNHKNPVNQEGPQNRKIYFEKNFRGMKDDNPINQEGPRNRKLKFDENFRGMNHDNAKMVNFAKKVLVSKCYETIMFGRVT